MLENLEEKIVVKSSAKGLMQHSGFSWSVEGTQFVCATEMSKDSQTMDAAFKSWPVSYTHLGKEKRIA